MTLPSAERELFFLHYYLIIISFLVLVLSFPFSILSFSAAFFSFFFFHYLGIHDMTKRSREGRFRLVRPKQKKKEKKSLGITCVLERVRCFYFCFLYFIFHLIQRHFLLLITLHPVIHSSIHPNTSITFDHLTN